MDIVSINAGGEARYLSKADRLRADERAVKDGWVAGVRRIRHLEEPGGAVGGEQGLPGAGGKIKVGVVLDGHGLVGAGGDVESNGVAAPRHIGENHRNRGGASGHESELG